MQQPVSKAVFISLKRKSGSISQLEALRQMNLGIFI